MVCDKRTERCQDPGVAQLITYRMHKGCKSKHGQGKGTHLTSLSDVTSDRA